MTSQVHAPSRPLIFQAIAGGIIGAIIVDSFLAINLHVSLVALEARNAALLAGPGASPGLGVIAHLAIALAWAIIYTYAFNAIGKLHNWILGTIVLGLAVNTVMTFAVAMKTGTPWGNAFVTDLIPNVIFYALPVALYLAFAVRRA
jgi:hypothetical protein